MRLVYKTIVHFQNIIQQPKVATKKEDEIRRPPGLNLPAGFGK